ncbi:hypothetical protein F183_A14350 [Bryobacterales bacterium F-183]|nr:hypothetical protein F183_A14350 [Bryobacterales bacterium F-183]
MLTRRTLLGTLTASAAAFSQPKAVEPGDPWTAKDLMSPADLAALVEKKSGVPVFYVGFPALYKQAHIPTAKMTGPCRQQSGLDLLKAELASMPKNKEFVLYCGCCPWDHCPNVRPAWKMVKEMGFTKAKLVTIPTNLHTDWSSKGYPTVRAQAPSE